MMIVTLFDFPHTPTISAANSTPTVPPPTMSTLGAEARFLCAAVMFFFLSSTLHGLSLAALMGLT